MIMIKHYYTCKLLSDVIISRTAATEEKHQTLDYIPGSYFLGIVAAELYKNVSAEVSIKLFHDGSIHFGDAQISANGKDKALKTPLSLFEFKDHNEAGFWHWPSKQNSNLQPKQVRDNYLCDGQFVAVNKDFNLRTAIENGVAKESSLYGYQSIASGQTFVFEVIGTVEALLEAVKSALVGTKRVGKSKSAAYGLAQIDFLQAVEPEKITVKKGELLHIYAEGNLAFFDVFGHPTFQPTPEQLGVPSGVMEWDSSQIQTRNFALYNAKRQTRDADIYAIEKGSVFLVKATEDLVLSEQVVGSYRAIGFGKVRYNLDWMVDKISRTSEGQQKTKWKPPFDVPATENETFVGKELLKRHQLQMKLAEAKQKLTSNRNSKELQNMSGSQWSQIIGLLDKENEKLLKLASTNTGQVDISQAIEQLENEIKKFISSDQRRLKWTETKADQALERLFVDARKQFFSTEKNLSNWLQYTTALRALFIKLR
jgi:hypothetical protein